MPTVESYQKDPIHEDIRMFEMELKKKFPDLVVTSGYRPNAKTKQGNPSRHGKGEAIDIRYNPEINEYLWNTKEGVALLNKYGLGFLDESDPETMKRTGATGKHTHLGFDSTLVPKTKQRYQELWGQEYAQQPQENINSEPTNFDENNTFSTFETQPVAHTKIGVGLPIINDEEETSKKQENTSKEKEALLQKQKEHQFIQDYLNGSVQRQVAQRRQQPQQQIPELNPLQEYSQISSFVENPIMQEGGLYEKIRNLRKGVRNNEDGTVSTHLMTYSQNDEGYQVYPTLFQKEDGSWYELPNGEENDWQALEEAIKRKEIFNFKTEEEAIKLANGSWKNKLQQGGQIPTSRNGVFDTNGEPVIVPSPNISMKNVDYPIMGISQETGEKKMMIPNMQYFFNDTKNVLEIPMMQQGGASNKNPFLQNNYFEQFEQPQQPNLGPYYPNQENTPYLKDVLIKDTLDIKENPYTKQIESTKTTTPKYIDIIEKTNESNSISFEELTEVNKKPKKDYSIPLNEKEHLEGKTKNEIKKLQEDLYENGYLPTSKSLILMPKTKDDVLEVQKTLLKEGYNLGTYGENKDGVDGIIGKVTKNAIIEYNNKAKGIDGIVGPNTKKAFEKYKSKNTIDKLDNSKVEERFLEINNDFDFLKYQDNLKEQGFFNGIDFKVAEEDDIYEKEYIPFNVTNNKKCEDNRCTFFVNSEIQKNVKYEGREKVGAFGDAWTLSSNLINSGGQEVFSIFEEQKPNLTNNQIEPYIKERIKQAKLPTEENVEAGDVVNLFYEGSSSKGQAYEEGDKYFTTHTGIVKQDDKGNKYIEHNVHGKILTEPLDKLLKKNGSNGHGMLAISAIIRPEYGISKDSKKYYDSSDAQINEQEVANYSNIGNKNSAIFTETLLKNREELQKDIPINNEEFKYLTKALKTIGWKESGFNSNIDDSSFRNIKKSLGKLRESSGGTELSRGLVQMKDEKNLIPNLREKYIKNKGQNLSNPKEASIPAFYSLSARYLYLKDLVKKENLNISLEEISKLSMLSWNEPLSKVSKTLVKNKTFDNTMEAYRGEDGKHNYDLAMTSFDKYLK